jgi:hypothetical protein
MSLHYLCIHINEIVLTHKGLIMQKFYGINCIYVFAVKYNLIIYYDKTQQ